MNLNYSEEQTMLREQIQKFCETEYDFYKREDVVKSDNDFDENVSASEIEQNMKKINLVILSFFMTTIVPLIN